MPRVGSSKIITFGSWPAIREHDFLLLAPLNSTTQVSHGRRFDSQLFDSAQPRLRVSRLRLINANLVQVPVRRHRDILADAHFRDESLCRAGPPAPDRCRASIALRGDWMETLWPPRSISPSSGGSTPTMALSDFRTARADQPGKAENLAPARIKAETRLADSGWIACRAP